MTEITGRVVSYLRLSKDDVSKSKIKKYEISNSIKNQAEIVKRFVEKNPGLIYLGEYVDDGRTGMDFNRPDFIRLENDAKAGKFDIVLVKDISRFGRNQTEVITKINKFISRYKVNVISITEDYNCEEDLDGLEMKIKILLNEFYSQNISEKVRAEVRSKQELGKFIGAFASYGYKKDPLDNNHLIIDIEPALIVKRIFKEFLEGKGKSTIARDLNKDGIPCPSLYKELNGLNYKNANKLDSTRQWTYSTVNKILHQQIYTGDMVQGKCKFSKFDRECKVYDEEEHLQIKAKQIDKDKWFIVPDTHEAIISREDFEITQGLLERNSRTIDFSNISLFAGMIRCGDCGKALVKNKSGNTVQYICSKYRQLGKTECTRHTIMEDQLIEIISKELKKDAEFYKNELAELKQKEIAYLERISHNDFTKEIQGYEFQIEKLQKEKREWVKNSVDGIISSEESSAEIRKITEQQDKLKQMIEKLKEENGKPTQSVDIQNKLIEKLANADFSVLTRKILQTYIKSITVFENKETGQKRVSIEKTYANPKKIQKS